MTTMTTSSTTTATRTATAASTRASTTRTTTSSAERSGGLVVHRASGRHLVEGGHELLGQLERLAGQ
jgi:hypothetical protein